MATPSREVASRIAIEISGARTRVRFWAAPTIDRPCATLAAATMRGTNERADGSTMAIPAPCSIRTSTNGASSPSTSTPGSSRTPDASRYRIPPVVNSRGAPNESTRRPPTRAAGIWTAAAAPITSPIAASSTPARASAKGMEAV